MLKMWHNVNYIKFLNEHPVCYVADLSYLFMSLNKLLRLEIYVNVQMIFIEGHECQVWYCTN